MGSRPVSNPLTKDWSKPLLGIDEIKALLRADASARSLALSNLVTMAIALLQQWPVKTVMFIYCGQNLIIGFFNVLRILNTREIVIPQKPTVSFPTQARYFLVGFFALHYGLFNFGYFQFIGKPAASDWRWVGLSLLMFLVHHLFSFRLNFKKEIAAWDFPRLMFFPYIRIIPMHIAIIFGGFLMVLFRNKLADRLLLILFLFLKTNADLKMHQVEHSPQSKQEPKPRDPLPEN